jgi:hypothetical protein
VEPVRRRDLLMSLGMRNSCARPCQTRLAYAQLSVKISVRSWRRWLCVFTFTFSFDVLPGNSTKRVSCLVGNSGLMHYFLAGNL